MSGDRTGPVTYGQLSVLRSLESYGPAGARVANLISVWPVPPGHDVSEVVHAWRRLVDLHESLRTSYAAVGGSFSQTVGAGPPGRVTVTELADDSVDAAGQAGAGLAVEPIDIFAAWPWRALVVTSQGEPVHLVTVVHHVAADNGALTVLAGQFAELLQGAAVSVKAQPTDLARMQREDPWGDQAVAYWAGEWAKFRPADRRGGDRSPRRRATLYSEDALAATQELSGRLRVSIQSAVLAAGSLALARLTGTPDITYALMAANRIDDRWAELVSSLNQCAPLTVSVDEDASADDFLRSTYYQSLAAYQWGSYDVDALRNGLGRAGINESDPTFFAKHFNFLGAAEQTPPPGSPARMSVAWRPSTQRSGPNFHLPVAVGEGLFIGIGASENLLPGQLPAVLAASTEAALLSLPDAAGKPLRQVSTEPVRTVGNSQ
jgi:condensation domain-containing protein